ncbi:MAG: hypothetical protein M1838_005029 [Thelocarpon superellum]|nr:MAG: hypothetical protein M1838_005029 [Thelocarpon superellum]
MDMSMDGMDMAPSSSMFMGAGMPKLFYLQQMYWVIIGITVGVAAVVNLLNELLAHQRLRAALQHHATPAKPASVVARTGATITAIAREISYASPSPLRMGGFTLRLPSLGKILVVLANLVVLIVLCLYGFNITDPWQYEDIGYRTGLITVCQMPLLFLLAGKNNIIGLLTGTSYERLNWLHRWAARCLLFTATLHMGYWITDWARFDYVLTKMQTDSITQKGLGAWGVLVWIVFSSMSPIRGWCYEFFLLQHLVSFAAFVGMVYIHTPTEVHVWIWIPVALLAIDRLIRVTAALYINLSIFHPRSDRDDMKAGLWACRAELVPLSHDATRIILRNPPISWRPGQHVFLSCHSIMPLQSHPFTIASIPQDGRMEFLVRAQKGGTRRLFRAATKALRLPTSEADLILRDERAVAIEGPYGRLRPLRQFDSVVFFAGSTGASFTVPLLRDLVRQWQSPTKPTRRCLILPSQVPGAATRHIRFVWVVQGLGQVAWFTEQLNAAVQDVQNLRSSGSNVELEMSIYITCDGSLTGSLERTPKQSSSSAPSIAEKIEAKADEKTGEDKKNDTNAIRERKVAAERVSCGPNGTCCCTQTARDELSSSASAPSRCNCHSNAPALAPLSSSTRGPLTLHSSIALLSGRPRPRNLIRTSLEQALGESAVVVCGPGGLICDVRRSVVALSDERAVHKGTGAQGIWLHCEGFGF